MSVKKKKYKLGVQITLWPMDEFDQPDVNNMTPVDEPLIDDIEGIINEPDKEDCRADHPGCPYKCKNCMNSEG